MSDATDPSGGGPRPAGWYHAQGDPVGTHRYWDGNNWRGEPQVINPQPNYGQATGAAAPDPSTVISGIEPDPIGDSTAVQDSSSDSGSFFQALFDTGFEQFVTRRAISIVYILAIVAIGLFSLFFLVAGLASGGAGALVALIMAPLVGLLYLIGIRMTLEFFVNQMRQSELLEEISAKLDGSG